MPTKREGSSPFPRTKPNSGSNSIPLSTFLDLFEIARISRSDYPFEQLDTDN